MLEKSLSAPLLPGVNEYEEVIMARPDVADFVPRTLV